MLAYEWPGNVREFEHCLEHAGVIASSPILQVEDLPASVRESQAEEPQLPLWGADRAPRRTGKAGDSVCHHPGERRQAEGRAVAGNRQDDDLPETERVPFQPFQGDSVLLHKIGLR
ncbi:MAG: hypothetical protein L0387_42415 [Acidobacteria bacterium]|nr:hypothetical protein [Acidobacteriota bacterium]